MSQDVAMETGPNARSFILVGEAGDSGGQFGTFWSKLSAVGLVLHTPTGDGAYLGEIMCSLGIREDYSKRPCVKPDMQYQLVRVKPGDWFLSSVIGRGESIGMLGMSHNVVVVGPGLIGRALHRGEMKITTPTSIHVNPGEIVYIGDYHITYLPKTDTVSIAPVTRNDAAAQALLETYPNLAGQHIIYRPFGPVRIIPQAVEATTSATAAPTAE